MNLSVLWSSMNCNILTFSGAWSLPYRALPTGKSADSTPPFRSLGFSVDLQPVSLVLSCLA